MAMEQLEFWPKTEYEIVRGEMDTVKKQTESVRRAIFYRVNELEKTILEMEKHIRELKESRIA